MKPCVSAGRDLIVALCDDTRQVASQSARHAPSTLEACVCCGPSRSPWSGVRLIHCCTCHAGAYAHES